MQWNAQRPKVQRVVEVGGYEFWGPWFKSFNSLFDQLFRIIMYNLYIFGLYMFFLICFLTYMPLWYVFLFGQFI